MVWIRRVRTTSLATAVQLVESVGGRRRIVRHIGSAHDETELGLLLAEARRLLAGDLQGELDLGLVSPVAYGGLLGPVASQPALIDEPHPRRRSPVGPPGVVKTCSDLLYGVLASVYDDLGFAGLDDDVFRDLVIAQVTEPTSLLDVDRVLADLGRVSASLSTRKRTLKRCATGDYRTRLAGWCFTQAGQAGDLSLVLYDVTTLRTQAEKEDDLRKVGFSKDRSVEAQIVVGLLVDRAGFPLQIGCFAGNQAEKATITPTIEAYTARNGLGRIVVAADAGMLSAKNLAALDAAGYWFIVGSRMVKAPIDLESHFRWYGDAFTDGQIVDTITPKMGKNIDNDPAKRFEPVWDPDTCPGSWRAVWQFSQKRFAHDNLTLTAQTNRAVQAVNGVKPARRPRFVAMTGKDTYRLDQAAIERARRLAGLKGYVTNMPAPIMQAQELIDHYHDLWHVEQSFRISKSDLQASPFFARKRDAIEAHLTIVFAALAIARTIQNRTGLTIRRVIRVLRPLRSATIRANGITQTIPPITDPDQQALINTLTTTPPRH